MADVDIQVELVAAPEIQVELASPIDINAELAYPIELNVDVVARGPRGPVGDIGAGVAAGGTTGQVLAKASASDYDTEWVDQSGGSGAVDSVNSQTGAVVLDADDIDDTSTAHKFVTASDLTTLSNTSGTNTGDQDLSGYATTAAVAAGYQPLDADLTALAALTSPATKLDGIEAGADVTDTANVTAAGAVMNTGNETVAGVKTFSSFPVTPSAAPTADYQTANKKYVDDEIIAAGGYNDEAAQDAIGTILTDSSEIDFTYNDATPSITASIVAGSIDETKLDTSVNASLDLADSATQPGDLATVATTGAYSDLTGTPTIPTVSDTAYDATSWNGNTDAPTKNAIRDKIESMGSGSGDVTGPASSTDNAIARFDSTTGKLLQDSGVTINDSGDMTMNGRDFDARFMTSYAGTLTDTITELTPAAGVTIDGVLVKDGEVDGRDVSADGSKLDGIEAGADVTDATNVAAAGAYMSGGADVALADGGTGASLTDPNADRIMFWDDSAGAVTWLTASTGLTISGTNITARTSSTTQTGIVELATDAETTTATDTARAVTPAGIGAERSATATLTNKTLTAPKLGSAGYIADVNGNEVIKTSATVASAVNEITVTNAATAGNPTISATGGDTNINLNLASKGAGAVLSNGHQVADTTSSQTFLGKTISGSLNTISDIGPSSRTGGFYIGTISAATLGTTGNKSITGVGFRPKLVRFIINTGAFSSTSMITSTGAMTSASQYVQMAYSSTSTSAKQGSTSHCIGFITSSSAQLLVSYVSMDADGFTINVGTANSGFDVAYEAYA